MSFLNLRLVFITNLIILPFIILTLPKPIVRPADLPASCHELRPITTPAAGSPTKPHAERTYDVVIYGATGFTGRLAALYMQSAAPTGTTWAIAGRSQAKLDKMNAELEHPVPTVIADSSDEEAVRPTPAPKPPLSPPTPPPPKAPFTTHHPPPTTHHPPSPSRFAPWSSLPA